MKGNYSPLRDCVKRYERNEITREEYLRRRRALLDRLTCRSVQECLTQRWRNSAVSGWAEHNRLAVFFAAVAMVLLLVSVLVERYNRQTLETTLSAPIERPVASPLKAAAMRVVGEKYLTTATLHSFLAVYGSSTAQEVNEFAQDYHHRRLVDKLNMSAREMRAMQSAENQDGDLLRLIDQVLATLSRK